MATHPGKMNERITLQSLTRLGDSGGGSTEVWANIPSVPIVWAQVMAKAGKEGLVSDRISASMVTLFIIRNRADLDETMRIVWRGSNYNIRGIRREGHRAAYLTIEAERGVAS
ncbi:phage head closure protein [Neotabrizicola sp. sgz301269]|uniref:phage head closure protein n=1 Tax=Neotabrizicola sp. sgz301269 TaxID=3276282 RepID=UPI00376F7593